ncbi:MAG: ferritin-like domain-containing protein [Verrucomicrobia bacterium]|nr:ferritin-like domain-containing protein [Verrucomicrobiota bacterium]
MDYETLNDLYFHELKDLYSAEKQILRAMPKVTKHVSSPALRDSLEQHREETRVQIERLEQIFERHGKSTRGAKCKGTEGVLEEAEDWIMEEAQPDVMDCGIISCMQRVEHYEIAGYGCARTYAQVLGFNEDESLLNLTLHEESETDKKLTHIAEKINQMAKEPEHAHAH